VYSVVSAACVVTEMLVAVLNVCGDEDEDLDSSGSAAAVSLCMASCAMSHL